MAYRIKQLDALETEVRRIAGEELDRAARALRPAYVRPTTIHAIRVHCKKMRALLRLVRTGLGRQYQIENRAFRDIARRLARSRDAQVIRTTIETLSAEHTEDDTVSVDHAALLGSLDHRHGYLDEQRERITSFADVRAALEAIEARAVRWRVRGASTRILSEGLGATYARARHAFERARDTRKTSAFHEWRKQVKYHGFHLKLLQSISSRAFPGRMKRITELSGALGELHDLDVLEAWLAQDSACASKDRPALGRRLERKRTELQNTVLSLGEVQFAHRRREIVGAMLKRLDAASAR